jgi:selenocysteine lyase/cysteine desulfurase
VDGTKDLTMTALADLAALEMDRVHTQGTYLNHAASSPLPRRSAEALRRYLDDREQVVPMYQQGRQDFDPTGLRASLGALMGAPAGAVAFVPTTTDGIAGVLRGIDWRPGDNAVVPADDFPGVVYAVLNLARLGVEPRLVPVDGHLDLDRLDAAVDARTRAVVASHVNWTTGYRIDLADLTAICRRVDAISVVDAIQSLGQTPVATQAAGVDVLLAGSYKWLMAVPGTAALYVSDRILAEVLPDRAGWKSMSRPRQATFPLPWSPDATRFHVGGQCDPALIALEQSVGLLLEVGAETIAERLRALQDRLLAGLPGCLRVASDLAPEHRSGILSVSTGDPDRDDLLVQRLAEARVIVARRGEGIRVTPHWHTRETDIDRFLEAAGEALGRS